MNKAAKAQVAIGDQSNHASFDRMNHRLQHTEATASAEIELLADDLTEKLNRLDRDAEVERLLTDIKSRRRLLPSQT
jgi:phage shock protein A